MGSRMSKLLMLEEACSGKCRNLNLSRLIYKTAFTKPRRFLVNQESSKVFIRALNMESWSLIFPISAIRKIPLFPYPFRPHSDHSPPSAQDCSTTSHRPSILGCPFLQYSPFIQAVFPKRISSEHPHVSAAAHRRSNPHNSRGDLDSHGNTRCIQ